MIQNYQISGKDICLLLFDQGILKMNEEDYSALENGAVSAYDFIMAKIYSLEITPAMLALEPCTGSAVITDPTTAMFWHVLHIRAMITIVWQTI